ncbi:MAG: NUDIX hydrolase [Acidimicrobiia bacterium]
MGCGPIRVEVGRHQVTARRASTVCLVRDTHQLEVLMVQRPHTSRFMPSVWVFPGGAVDEADADPPSALVGIDDWRVAAFREMIEETGLWVTSEGVVERSTTKTAFADIEAGDASFDAEDLVYFSNWITPEVFPLRFDTRFFLGVADAGITGEVDGDELVDLEWVHPLDALRREEDSTWDVAFPTRRTLELLASESSASDIHERLRTLDIVPPVQPRLYVGDSDARIVMPDDDLFEEIGPDQSDPDLLVRLGEVIAKGGDSLPAEFKRRK